MKLLLPYNKYRAHPALNYSLLSKFSVNPKSASKEIKESTSMTLGSLVDLLLTQRELFDLTYYVSEYSKPTATLGNLYEILTGRVERFDLREIEEEGFKIIEECKFWNNIKNKDVLKRKFLIPELINPLKEYYISKGRIVISIEEYEKAQSLVTGFLENEFTSSYFESTENREILYQVPIVFKFNKQEFKILLDGLIIDHEEKVIRPFDIKTSLDSVYSFPSKVYRFRYDIQAALYTEGVIEFAAKNFKGYKVETFEFLVGSFAYPESPIIYDSTNILESGRQGKVVSNKAYRGFISLAEDYNWHVENDLWEYSREAYENNGKVILKYV